MSYGSPKWRDWVLDYDASKPFFKRALDLGINFFDTADMYSDGESEVVTDVVRAGKVLYIGASSMYAYQFAKMLHVSDTHGYSRFVTMQNHYNLVYREEEREMNPLCREEGVGLIPWSPLARGFLAGNRTKESWGATTRAKSDDFAHNMYYEDSDFAVVQRVSEVAKKRGVPNAQVAIAWLLQQPGVTAPTVIQPISARPLSCSNTLSGDNSG